MIPRNIQTVNSSEFFSTRVHFFRFEPPIKNGEFSPTLRKKYLSCTGWPGGYEPGKNFYVYLRKCVYASKPL